MSVPTALLLGHSTITGASSSVTVTMKQHSTVLPAPSVALYVTVVAPSGNSAFGPRLDVSVTTTPRLSEAEASEKSTTANASPASVVIEMSAAHVMT
eukprot:108105-Rhodomonas_salina.1